MKPIQKSIIILVLLLVASVVLNSGITGAITIPTIVIFNSDNYSVASTGRNAFRYCSGLTSITINRNIKA